MQLCARMTLDAADIFGLSDRLGSIEPGKIANLVVTDGDIFNEKTKVKHVFVDGRWFEIHEEAARRKNRAKKNRRMTTARDRGKQRVARGWADEARNSLSLLACDPCSLALARAAARAQNPGTIFIQNATMLTVSHGNIEHGSILIRDGKIAAVGTDLKAPEGAKVIDATGQYVMPGIIDCHSHIAIDGSVNEGGACGFFDGEYRGRPESRRHRYLSRSRRRRDDREYSARQRQSDRRPDRRDQAALGKAGERIAV